jgi:predicted nuclease of predicted toxin-antitoxin system
MSRLFIELYLDEDVSVLVSRLVRARGFVATTTHDEGLHGRTDAEQLAHAASRQMSLLTHNRADFEALARDYLATGQTHHGIIIAVRRPPHEITRRLLAILNQVTADEMENQLRYI